jgi:hypothetical protein
MVDVRCKVFQQLDQRREVVGMLLLRGAHMPMVSFAQLVVVANNGLPASATVEAVFESVNALRWRNGQKPDLALNDAAVAQDRFRIKNQAGFCHVMAS